MEFRNRFGCRQALKIVTFACCTVFSPLLSTLPAAIVFDLKTDWSDFANPNGPWSYRQGNDVLPHVNDWQGLSGDFTGVQPAWARVETGNANLPAWMKIASPAGIPTDWQLGDIVTHSTDDFNGVGSGPSNVIWTSPFNGMIDVSGGVWMGRDIGRGNHWDISKNGTSLTGGDIFSGDLFNRNNPFLFSAGSGGTVVLNGIPVAVGDVLRLQITRTSLPGDYAVVDLAVTATADVSGDFDHDGDVDGADLLVWQRGGSPTPNSPSDLAAWKGNFGAGAATAATTTVPEPETLLVALAAAVGLRCVGGRMRQQLVSAWH